MFKWTALTIGTLFGVAHIGILGHLINRPGVPVINLPVGDYTSYSVEDLDRDGYKIDYSSNDPKVIEKKKTVDKENGFLGIGGRTTVITDEEYTMGGQEDNLGKSNAKREECIKATVEDSQQEGLSALVWALLLLHCSLIYLTLVGLLLGG